MNFINQYKDNGVEGKYVYAEEFSEAGVAVIYGVGNRNNLALITKTDENGEIIWEKTWEFPMSEVNLSFQKIVSASIGLAGGVEVGVELAFQYVLYATDNTNYWLIGINESGEELWCKAISRNEPDLLIFLEPSLINGGFFLVISFANLGSGSNPVIAKFDGSGDLIISQTLYMDGDEFIVKATHTNQGFLVLGCMYMADAITSLIITLDTNLSVDVSFRLWMPYMTLHDIKLTDSNHFILSGFLTNEQLLCIVDMPYAHSEGDIYEIPGTGGYLSKICLYGDDFYFIQYNGQDNTIHFVNSIIDIEWSKRLVTDFQSNGIQYLNYNQGTDALTFSDSNTLGNYLIHSDQSLNSCKTDDRPIPFLSTTKLGTEDRETTPEEVLLNLEWSRTSSYLMDTDKTEACPSGSGGPIVFDQNTLLQSPAFYLQAAGSAGNDGSAEGIHLRWIFGGGLGEKHLPKGNYATTMYNFNKPDDFVRVYRTPYYRAKTVLNFAATPYLVDDTNKVWLYRVGTKVFYVYFRNVVKYNNVRATNIPLQNPIAFINAYGGEIIEVENKNELFFAAELRINLTGLNASIKTETLSVSENALAVPKTVSSRKTFIQSQLGNIHLLSENGRSIRFRPNNCIVPKINFEFYSDFIRSANDRSAWQYIDQFALTQIETVAFQRLEPGPQLIDGKWERFNDNEYVNTDNYKEKWSGPREPWDRNILGVVQAYIQLSDASANPRALEEVPLESEDPGDDDFIELSNLDLLNMAAYDYHIARMLGLGTLDLNSSVMSGKHVYVAQYYTKSDLQNGGGNQIVNLLSMTLPTSLNDERLPLPINLRELRPGAFLGNESPNPVSLTDSNGYSHDGTSRYVTIYTLPQPDDETNKPFYFTTGEFNYANYTNPVYAGIEYKKNNESAWQKPELPNDIRYQNRPDPGLTAKNETIPIVIPENQDPLFVHQQRVSGIHYYSSYGINWFSRSFSSEIVLSINTVITPVNPLNPPSDIQPLLIREETPVRLLTSQAEQDRFNNIPTNDDHTLIRISFEYHSAHELISYKIPDGVDVNDPNVIPADSTEIYADEIEIFFRKDVPGNISGKVISIDDDPSNNILSLIETGSYTESSTGNILQPIIGIGQVPNYIGGVFIMGDQQFIIHEIILPTGGMTGPRFTVYKKEISAGIITNEIPPATAVNLQSPILIPDGLFMAVENMLNPISWGSSNPLSFKVDIGIGWNIHRELITIQNSDGTTEEHLEKTRGMWDMANTEAINEPVDMQDGSVGSEHRGLYKFTFSNSILPLHSQDNLLGNSVEWYKGVIRVHTISNPTGIRKVMKVVKIENIGTANPVIVYAYDATFMTDSTFDHISTGINNVNFYPGYKVYLYEDATYGLTYPNILPAPGEGIHYSVFGLRSHDIQGNFYSKISPPQLMFAQEQVEALIPDLPLGALYATRPDFFGRSTYTLRTTYSHKPYGVLYYRSNDEALLNALYEKATVVIIRQNLKQFGANEEAFLTNRWQNFLDFTLLGINTEYLSFPLIDPLDPQPSYKFPNPDKQALFIWANGILQKLQLPLITEIPGTLKAGDPKIINFVKGAVYNAFVPLTEMPVIYQYIRSGNYLPVSKKQILRNRNGNVLQPTDPEFDMAPMMKITGGANYETIFSDFTLDGTSDNIYFYGAKELSTQMKMSDFSPFLGPVKLVNTNAPEAPQIKRIMPVLANEALGIFPSIQLELNAYPEVQHIKKVNIYRSFNKLDAQSVRSMQLIKIIDLDTAGIINDPVWQISDDFNDLSEIPYNDGLFYRLTVSRKVEYDDLNGNVITEYAPSQPSKITATLIVEASNPPAPILSYTSDAPDLQGNIDNVTLFWDKVAYNAKYHIYKMNNSGNWVKIGELISNGQQISVPLSNTDLLSNILPTLDGNGNNIYSHFKVVAENTSGMLSLEENILTIPN